MLVTSLLALVAGACECTPGDDPADGPELQGGQWPEDPERIVSMAPVATELLFELGLGDRVVAVTRYCDWPEQVDDLDSIGGMLDPDFEAIVAAEPDVVVGTADGADDRVAQRFERAGIAYGFVRVDDFDSVRRAIDQFARWFDVEPRGQTLLEEFDDRLAAATRSRGGAPRAVMVLDTDPVIAAGPGSFGDELLAHAGLTNAIEAGADDYPMLDAEQLLQLDPQLVIITDLAASRGEQPAVFDDLQPRRIIHIDDPVVLRPGPRIPRAVELLVERTESS